MFEGMGTILLVITLVLIVFGLGMLFVVWLDEQRKAEHPMRPYHMARRKR